jgi:phosphoglycolate phosphatase
MTKENTIILFDLDGTLIDSTDAILESFHVAFEKQDFNFQGSDEDIKNEIGHPLDVMFTTLGVDANKAWDFVDSYKEHYRTISEEKTYLLENAKEAVVEASKIARLGVVTTKTTQYSIPILETLGIWEYFETIVGRQEVQNPKPHPEPIFTALKLFKAKGDEKVFMIGDTIMDLEAAQKANVQGVGVLCGYGGKEQMTTFTDLIFDTAIDAVNALKN